MIDANGNEIIVNPQGVSDGVNIGLKESQSENTRQKQIRDKKWKVG